MCIDAFKITVQTGEGEAFGILRGNLSYGRTLDSIQRQRNQKYFEDASILDFHRPHLGGMPMIELSPLRILISIPSSILLAAMIGWLAWRELRWRETARAPALPPDAGGQSGRSGGSMADNPGAKST